MSKEQELDPKANSQGTEQGEELAETQLDEARGGKVIEPVANRWDPGEYSPSSSVGSRLPKNPGNPIKGADD